MELKDRKFINNTGNLPGFEVGKQSEWTLHLLGGALTLNSGVKSTTSAFNGARLGLNASLFFGTGELTKPKNQYNPFGNSFLRSGATLATQSAGNINNGNLKNPITGKSPNQGPTQSDSAAAGISPWFALGSWAGGGILEGLGRILSADEHLADAGTSLATVNGIAYTQLNSVDTGKIMSDYDRSTATDFLTNPFRGLTSLFGRGRAKREAELAAEKAHTLQYAARDDAYTKYIRLESAKKYGNPEDQMLYAKNGKLPKCEDGLVSALGKIDGEATARVSNGEVIANKALGTMYRVPGLKNNKDGKLAALNDSDTVITNKYGLSDYAWRTGDIEGAEEMMKILGKPSYKCGKLPKLAEGWLGNFVPSALGSLASLDQMLLAYNNKPYRPNTYASNPYELEGLTTLAGLRVNPYPIMNQLRSAEARTNRAVDIAGGLSAALRNSARLAALNTTQNNISNLLSNIQTQNNAYRTTYAKAALEAGQQARTARMQANQWDLDMYSKAHAARNKGIQTGIANMLSQIQQYQANEFKRRQFNDTMDLYRADQKLRNEQNQWMRNWYASQGNTANTYSPLQPVNTKATPIQDPYAQYDPNIARQLAMLNYLGYKK